MVCEVVCALMLYGLLVAAYPTDDSDGNTYLVELPVEGLAQFSGSVPATGSVSILGQSSCPPLVTSSLAPTTLESDDNIEFEESNESSYPNVYDENDESDCNDKEIPKQVILGALLARTITAVKGAEINATLAELDAFVETELQKIETVIESSVANVDTSDVDGYVDAVLTGLESQIITELDVIDKFVDSELATTEKLVKDLVDNLETDDAQIETVNAVEEEALVELELGILESLVDSLLANTESVVDLELNKVNEFVESELAKVNEIVNAELEKVDLLIETELAKTDALVKSELANVDAFVEAELAKVEMAVQDIVDFCGVVPDTDTAAISETCGYEPELLPEETVYDDTRFALPVVKETAFCTVVPAVGGCRITRVFPCENMFSLPNRNGVISPMPVGPFSKYIQNSESGHILSQMRILPAVNLQRNGMPADDGQNPNDVNTDGIVGFGGTTKATGAMRLFNQFPCPPLLPTQVGPDGKKYIWIAPKSTKLRPNPPRPTLLEYPPVSNDGHIDSSKNYENIRKDLDVDFKAE